jgi:hydroxyethylthiazole kinase-like uncharacterized protein yjeF
LVAFKQLYRQLMPPRCSTAHKGLYGHVLIIGGGPGMPGAVVMAANAALRVGAGMVSVATWPDYAKQSLPSLPEAMVHAALDAESLAPLIEKATACILGPGLGETDWAKALFSALIKVDKPLLIDASALHLLADTPANPKAIPSRSQWVLTPHPGEAAALLHCAVHEVQANRQNSALRIQQQYGGTVVLKGHETLIIHAKQQITACDAGNPGMATAGMGDVLSGVIGGLMAQGLSPSDAAQLGVWLHALAGDRAAKSLGERGLLASDLMPFLQQLSNPELSL